MRRPLRVTRVDRGASGHPREVIRPRRAARAGRAPRVPDALRVRRVRRVLSPAPSAHPRVEWAFIRFLDAFPWGYMGVGVVGNVLFFVGSCLFVLGVSHVVSGSLFVAGSALMLAGSLGNLSRYDWKNQQEQLEQEEEQADEEQAEGLRT